MELITKILTFLRTWKMKLNHFLVNAESVIDQTQELIGTNKPEPVVQEEPQTTEEAEEVVEPQTEEVVVPTKAKKSKLKGLKA